MASSSWMENPYLDRKVDGFAMRFWKRWWPSLAFVNVIAWTTLIPNWLLDRAEAEGRTIGIQCLTAAQLGTYPGLVDRDIVGPGIIQEAKQRDRKLGRISGFKITFTRGHPWGSSWETCAEVTRGSKAQGECIRGRGDHVRYWGPGSAYPEG